VIVDRQGPSIGEPFTFPEWDDICTWGIWIQTEITDPSGVDRAELHYLHVPEVGISDSGIVEMTRDGDSFSATLGPFPEGELRYWIVAWDIPGNESRTDKHRKGVVTC
jgi:hypothetical protein